MSVKIARSPAAVILALALAGCGQAGDGGGLTGVGSAGLCTPFKSADTAATAPAPGSPAVDECLHRWGYALAAAHENADVIAAATVTACSAAIVVWNQQALSQAGQSSDEATSLTTGQPVDPLTEHAQFAQSQALFYVVQARAGKCSPPPNKLLVRG